MGFQVVRDENGINQIDPELFTAMDGHAVDNPAIRKTWNQLKHAINLMVSSASKQSGQKTARIKELQEWIRKYKDHSSVAMPAPNLDPTEEEGKNKMWESFKQAQEKLTPEFFTDYLANAQKKGDANTLRMLAVVSGVDLSSKNPVNQQHGIDYFVFEPFEEEIDAARDSLSV